MKKKIILGMFFLLVVSAFAENISYNVNGHRKTVDADYIGTQETRLFIQGGFLSETWIVIEKCFLDVSTKQWSDWEKYNEVPSPKATNSDLMEIVNEIIGTVTEDELNGSQLVLFHVKNSDNQDYWWENRKYLCFLQYIYLVK
jgi:hypothetical protein